ncbi:hypothetical protein [Hymenobacter metallicola]|uniref:Uncharacterized protein n=1 Tax=Hymenobacter metallicola TaxID=2563114 RepID=A0A4Z0QCE5_9BACT|nr:hypothetical protein [Hymenobacter metallicola]TGE27039.1 hypothetical protein E5K02_11580 [Hymenobacter metallicola]
MQKFIYLLGFGLTTSLAVAQGQATPAARYLMLVREVDASDANASRRISLTVIAPDGTFRTEELQVEANKVSKKAVNASIARFTPDSTNNFLRRQRYIQNIVHQAEVKKLNELSAQGWQLVSTTQEAQTIRYLFRKDGPAN